MNGIKHYMEHRKKMMSKFKDGDVVVRNLHGGGFVTNSLVTIEHVDENGTIFIEGADGDYSRDSVYAFHGGNHKSINNYTPGFYSVLSHVATQYDIDELSEE